MVDHLDAAAILRDIADLDTVPLGELSARLGLSYQQQSRGIRDGLITPTGRLPGPGHPYAVDQGEAARLVLATALAFAAGLAVLVILRGLKGAGFTGDLAAATIRQLDPT
jgi:hypothetical protein